MTLFRRSLFILLLVCLYCAAQSADLDVALRIEHQMRVSYAIPPDVKVTVGAITPSSEVPGYDTVSINIDSGNKQKDYTFLVSKDRGTLMRLNKFDLTKDAFAQVMNKIDVTARPVRGTKSAKVLLVNFDDFECPFCARLHETLFPEILREYGDRVSIIYKDDPVTEIHPWALHAAVDANCLAAQNSDAYWDFADYIHGHRQDIDGEKTPSARLDVIDKLTLEQGPKHNLDTTKLQSCIKTQDESAVRASMREAAGLGITGTPVLFINGQRIDGAVPISTIRAGIDAALRAADRRKSEPAMSDATPASK